MHDPATANINGSHIRAFREQKGWTQRQLAEFLNVNVTSVNRWESDEADSPTSTAYLVLLPLIMGAGIPVEVCFDDNATEMLTVMETIEDPAIQKTVLEQMKRKMILRASRDLYTALSTAFEAIDNPLKMTEMITANGVTKTGPHLPPKMTEPRADDANEVLEKRAVSRRLARSKR